MLPWPRRKRALDTRTTRSNRLRAPAYKTAALLSKLPVGDVGHGTRNPDDVRIEALSWDCIVRLAWLDGVCPREVVSGCHLVGPPRLP